MQRSLLRGGSVLLAAATACQLCAQAPSYHKIGEGCAGSVGTPVLAAEASAVPILGEAFRAQITNVPDGSAIGILGLSTVNWAGYELPLELSTVGMPGCVVYTDVRRASMLSIVGGEASWETVLPDGTEWIGQSFYQQVFVFDAGVNALGAVMSNAAEAVIAAPQPAPFASIAFPPPNSLTNRESVLVRGRAFDPDGVGEVRVNGFLAESSDAFANWQVRVPLINGTNKLVVEARDHLGKFDPLAAEARIESQAPMSSPRGIVIDHPRNRVLLTDSSTRSVIAVDLTSGKRRIIADAVVGTGPVIVGPWDIALDGSRAILLDAEADQLVAIDLLTGERSIVSSTTKGSGPAFLSPISILVEGSRAMVVDGSLDALFAVDLMTGDRTILSGNGTGSGPDFAYPRAAAIDIANNRALVVDSSLDAVVAVDLTTGDRSVLSDRFIGAGPRLTAPDDIIIDSNRALVTDSRRIVSVSLDTGDRTVVSDSDVGSGPEFLVGPNGIALDRSRVLVTDTSSPFEPSQGRVLSIDLGNGSRSAFPDLSIGMGEGFISPEGIAIDGTRALIAHREPEPFGSSGSFYSNWLGSIMSVDLLTGDRTVVSPTTSQFGYVYMNPGGIIIDGDSALATGYAISSTGNLDGGIFALHLVTGFRTLFADTSSGPFPWINAPIAIARDGSRLLVLDQADPRSALFALDPKTGARNVVSSNNVGSGPEFGFPNDLAVTSSQALITDARLKAVFAVDLVSGNRSLLSDMDHGLGPNFEFPTAIAIDGQHAIVIDTIAGAAIAVDLETGDRSVISDAARGLGPALLGSDSIAITGELGLASSGGLRAIIGIDLQTGERVIISM